MTTLFKKLNYKGEEQIIVSNAPGSFVIEMKALADFEKVQIKTEVSEVTVVEFALCFVTTQSEISTFISAIAEKMKGDATLWLCYPKASSKKFKCEFNRDNGFKILGDYGLEPVRQVAIDNDWSALRFRKVEFIKKITRRASFALTEEAKKRTTKKGE